MTNTLKQMPETWTYGQWFMANEWEPDNGMIAWIVVDREAIVNNGISPEEVVIYQEMLFKKIWKFHSVSNVWLSLENDEEDVRGWGHNRVVMFMPILKPEYPDMWDIEKAMEYSAQHDAEKRRGRELKVSLLFLL